MWAGLNWHFKRDLHWLFFIYQTSRRVIRQEEISGWDNSWRGRFTLTSPEIILSCELLQFAVFLFSPLVVTSHGNGNGQVSVDSPRAAARAGTFWISERRMAASTLFRHFGTSTVVPLWIQQHCRRGSFLLPVCLLELQNQHYRLQLWASGKRMSGALV